MAQAKFVKMETIHLHAMRVPMQKNVKQYNSFTGIYLIDINFEL